MGECLSELEIVALAADEPLQRDRATVDSHLKSCSRCRDLVQGARSRRLERHSDSVTQVMPSRSVSTGSDSMLSLDGYEMLGRVQGGGQGVVYKAIQKSTSRLVAVKVLPHEDTASDRQKQRFEREVSLAASLRHPNIVTIYDSGLTSGRYFFAMEYIHGQPLDEAARNLNRDAKLVLFAKICDAVAHAHQQNVVHRDLKPGNVLVDARGEPHVVDFGLAKSAGALLAGAQQQQQVTLTSQFMGTLNYASPEQTLGDPMLVDRRSDVYSLGVILFEMLTGEFPYRMPGELLGTFNAIRNAPARKPSQVTGGIDRDLDTIVLRALAKEPARRYQSAEEFAADIRRYQAREPIAARRDSVVYVSSLKARAALRRHRVLTMLGVTAAATLLASVLTPWVSNRWSWPARWYEHVAAGGLKAAPVETGAFANVRFIAITDQTEAEVPELARLLNLAEIDATEWVSMRRMHRVLMERLAAAKARAVAWDIAFEGESRFDADFAKGVAALTAAGAGVAVAMNDWMVDAAGNPVVSSAILNAGVLYGGVTLGVDELSVWKCDVVVQHPGDAPLHSLAIAGMAAWRHPGMNVTARIDRSAERLELLYSALRTMELVPLSAVRTPEIAESEEDQFGLKPETYVGLYAVRLPPDDTLASITREYQDVLRSDPESGELESWCKGKLVVIGDLRSSRADFEIVDGRKVFRPYVQAAMMDSLLRNAIPARYPRQFMYLLMLVSAAIGGVLVAQGFWSGQLLRIGGLVVLMAVIIGLCIVAFKVTGYLCQPMGPVMAMALAFLGWLWFDSVYSHHPRTEAPGSAGTHSFWRDAS